MASDHDVLDYEVIKRMAASNVLIVGMRGLGVQIAKNVILAGVKSVTIFDPDPVTIQDLSSQFLCKDDLGKARAEAILPRLEELINYVRVRNAGGLAGQDITVEQLKGFQVVVLTDRPLSKQLEINAWTRENGVYFVAAETHGLFGSAFNDFGAKFNCVDPTGEEPRSGLIAAVEKNDVGLVTCLDETRHGLKDGDYVTFTGIKGMWELNRCDPRKITVNDPYAFAIGDTSGFSDYISGGIFARVKMPKVIEFKSLAESLKNPEFFITDLNKLERPAALHVGFQALWSFFEQNCRLPRPRNYEDAAKVVAIAKSLSTEEFDEHVVQELAFQATGDLAPLHAVIGGFAAQEVLKAISGKFHPTVQHTYFDALEALPAVVPTEAECSPMRTRYDGQIAVFGRAFRSQLANHRAFLVGAGAIACETLKRWSLVGFQPKDIDKFRSEAGRQGTRGLLPTYSLFSKASPKDTYIDLVLQTCFDDEDSPDEATYLRNIPDHPSAADIANLVTRSGEPAYSLDMAIHQLAGYGVEVNLEDAVDRLQELSLSSRRTCVPASTRHRSLALLARYYLWLAHADPNPAKVNVESLLCASLYADKAASAGFAPPVVVAVANAAQSVRSQLHLPGNEAYSNMSAEFKELKALWHWEDGYLQRQGEENAARAKERAREQHTPLETLEIWGGSDELDRKSLQRLQELDDLLSNMSQRSQPSSTRWPWTKRSHRFSIRRS